MKTHCATPTGRAIPALSENPAYFDLLKTLQEQLTTASELAIAGHYGLALGELARARITITELALHENAVWGRKEH